MAIQKFFVSQVADDAQESKVESLRCTVSQLEAELKEARSKLEFHLDVPVSTGTPTEVTQIQPFLLSFEQ